MTKTNSPQPLVAVIMGSVSDGHVVNKALQVLDQFEVPYEVGIKSAHRTPEHMLTYARDLAKRGVKIVIAIAGGSAHLPGMVASETCLPVLAVPVRNVQKGHGDEATKSSIAMPAGIPLATFGNNAADRAALFAIRTLAISDAELQETYLAHQSEMTATIRSQDEKISEIGWEAFLEEHSKDT